MTQIPDHPMIRQLERDGYPYGYADEPDEDEDDQYSIPDDEAEEEDDAPESVSLIQVAQLPIIAERLYLVKESVEATVKEAASMICTADTVQAVKAKRAELRKQFDELEEQRKAVKLAILAPYDDFEKVYRECISGPFKSADAVMKEQIDSYENELKAACKESLRGYFDELCAAHGVDFLSFETALNIGKIKIGMADATAKTPRKLQDALSEVVARVAVGMDDIAGMEDAAEIMAEYKICFDVGRAAATVQGRKRRIEAEKEAAEARRAAQERAEAAEAKVIAVAPPTTAEPPQEPQERVYPRVTMTLLNITKSQAVKIRDFLKQEGIEYE